MNIRALKDGKIIIEPLDKLVAEHRYLSDGTSWYICMLGDALLALEKENEILKERNKK